MHLMLKNRVLKNATWIIICRVVQMIINLFVGMLTARYLGPSNYGVLNYASSIVAFVAPIMQLGLGNILVQEITNNPEYEGKTLGTSIILSLCSAILCIIGVTAFVMVANAGEIETIIICSLYSLTLLFQAFEVITYWFQAKLLSKYTSILMLVAYCVVAIYKIYLLISSRSIYWFAASQIIDCIVIAIGNILIYKKVGKQRFSFSGSLAKKMISKSHYYIIANMMVMVFSQTDKIMLKLMLNSEETGYYSAAITIASMTNFVFAAIIDSMRPGIFKSKNISKKKYEGELSLLYALVFYLSLFQCILMTILAKPIIFILYGKNYLSAVSALQIGVWYTTFAYIGTVRNIWILAEDKQKYLWIINVSGAIANIGLNYILIPIMGINGASLASLATQFFTNVVISYLIRPLRRNNEIMMRGINPQLILKHAKGKRIFRKDEN